jgi:hypothetical protein
MARMGDLAGVDDYAPDELLVPPVDPRTGRVGGIKGPPASAWATLPGAQAIADPFRTARKAYEQGLTPEEEIQFGVNTAVMGLGSGVPFAPRGAIGAFGAKTVIPTQSPKMGDLAAPTLAGAPYLINPVRTYKPGVYKDPRTLALEAEAQVAPEHEALKQLFGVTRDDLYQIGQAGARPGNMEPQIWTPRKPGSSYVAESVMTPANAQRMQDAIVEGRRLAPELSKGMSAWYVMDPAFHQMVKLFGPERAVEEYRRFNSMMTPFSASSNVMTEINRGTVARMLAERNQLKQMEKYGSMPVGERGRGFPKELQDMIPHPYNEVQVNPVLRYLKTGEHGYANDTVKIPLYTQATGVPATGFQTRLPVPDAHFSRAVGAPDVRRGATGIGDYMGGSEYRQFGPWYRENVARPVGLEAVPGQAIQWGLYAPQTGVTTAIGAPKLELLSQSIWERAKKLGIDPKVLRDRVLRGEEHAELPNTLGSFA